MNEIKKERNYPRRDSIFKTFEGFNLSSILGVALLIPLILLTLQRASFGGEPVITRVGDYTAGKIKEVHFTSVGTTASGNGLSVTAVRLKNNGKLKIIAWEIAINGTITRKGSHNAGYISEGFDIAFLAKRQFVTAVRLKDERLKLILWNVSEEGVIVRRGDFTAGKVEKVSIAFVKTNRFVTAVRLKNNRLKLIAWHIQGTDIYRDAEVLAGGILDVSAISLKSRTIVTAVRLKNNSLKLIAWRVSFDNIVDKIVKIERKGSALAGSISEVHAVHITSHVDQSEIIATAVRLPNDNLKIIVWSISPQGTITRKGSVLAGGIRNLSASRIRVPNMPGHLLTAVRLKNDRLKLIVWNITGDGNVKRSIDRLAGRIESVSVRRSDIWQVLTAVRLKKNDALKLITWNLSSKS